MNREGLLMVTKMSDDPGRWMVFNSAGTLHKGRPCQCSRLDFTLYVTSQLPLPSPLLMSQQHQVHHTLIHKLVPLAPLCTNP